MSEKQKILAVDDDARNIKIMTLSLGDQWDVRVASSGEEALTILNTWTPDLVLLDIMMPGIGGYEVCRRIRKNPKFNFTKVILISGKAMIDERLQGYEAGADDYMTKPYVPEELLAKVKVFARLAETESQLHDINVNLEKVVEEKTNRLLEAEGKLINSAKLSALGEMANGIAHEINNPLTSIKILSGQLQDLAKKSPLNPEQIATMSSKIEKTVDRIAKIINGLRTFARDGQQDSLATCRVKQIIDETMDLCLQFMKEKEIEISADLPNPEITVPCRAIQISQVLLNLIMNSRDAIADLPEKWIKVSVEPHGEYLGIRVTDSGAGIPKSVQEKMFNPFFTTKDIGKGTGLGLSISKGIMKSHHGDLIIDQQNKNTSFLITIPLVAKQVTITKQVA